MDEWRGNKIKKVDDNTYIYLDDGVDLKNDINRRCGHCGLNNDKDGHDPCFGKLDGVLNACCGHGITDQAYIKFENGETVRGNEAIKFKKDSVLQEMRHKDNTPDVKL